MSHGRTMRRVIPTPGDAPPWFARAAREIERTIAAPADAPIRLQAFSDAAALPAAADWPFGLVYVESISMVAVSTGSVWIRLDTGATL